MGSSRRCVPLVLLCGADGVQNPEYRQLLIQTIHTCAIQHSSVASNVVHVLMEFLGDASNASAVDVIAFVREVVEKFPELRAGILEKLQECFSEIKSGKVFRGALWILGEYGESASGIMETMRCIRKVLGEVPILASEQVRATLPCSIADPVQRLLDESSLDVVSDADAAALVPTSTTSTRVLADGTYATETVFSSLVQAENLERVKAKSKPVLRALILGGDYYTATVLAGCLTKLVLRFRGAELDERVVNEFRAEVSSLTVALSDDADETPGDVDHDVHHPCRTVAVLERAYRRGRAGAHPQLPPVPRCHLDPPCPRVHRDGSRPRIAGRPGAGGRHPRDLLGGHAEGVFQDGAAPGGRSAREAREGEHQGQGAGR